MAYLKTKFDLWLSESENADGLDNIDIIISQSIKNESERFLSTIGSKFGINVNKIEIFICGPFGPQEGSYPDIDVFFHVKNLDADKINSSLSLYQLRNPSYVLGKRIFFNFSNSYPPSSYGKCYSIDSFSSVGISSDEYSDSFIENKVRLIKSIINQVRRTDDIKKIQDLLLIYRSLEHPVNEVYKKILESGYINKIIDLKDLR